jgi:mRNA-degrading endonuclease toxin of MazEF toxin-antitoxin module
MSIANALRQGDIYMFDATGAGWQTAPKERPCVILQNDCENDNRPVTLVAVISSNITDRSLPFAVPLERNTVGLSMDSAVNCGHIYTISKSLLHHKIGQLTKSKMGEVQKALAYLLGTQ